jgi:4-hydroxy-tetrahydrodipicolinate synthase
MQKEDLHGYVPAIATPFNDRGEIMEDAFVDLFEFLLSRGATCICIAGDNGESWALSAHGWCGWPKTLPRVGCQS